MIDNSSYFLMQNIIYATWLDKYSYYFVDTSREAVVKTVQILSLEEIWENHDCTSNCEIVLTTYLPIVHCAIIREQILVLYGS